MTHREITPDMFRNLTLPRKEASSFSSSRYRVYKTAKEFVVVEAENAKAALAASGLTQARRIERENIYLNNVLTLSPAAPQMDKPEKTQAAEAPAATPEPAEVQEATPPAAEAQETAAAAPPAAAQAPLSNEEVNKLLQG